MTDKQRFTSVWDAIADTPQEAASMRARSALMMSYDDYLTNSLTEPAEAAAYLDAVIEMEDTPALLLALRQVAKAHGMAEVGGKTLFRALSETGNPTLDTVTKVLHAMGLRLSVEPLHTHA